MKCWIYYLLTSTLHYSHCNHPTPRKKKRKTPQKQNKTNKQTNRKTKRTPDFKSTIICSQSTCNQPPCTEIHVSPRVDSLASPDLNSSLMLQFCFILCTLITGSIPQPIQKPNNNQLQEFLTNRCLSTAHHNIFLVSISAFAAFSYRKMRKHKML